MIFFFFCPPSSQVSLIILEGFFNFVRVKIPSVIKGWDSLVQIWTFYCAGSFSLYLAFLQVIPHTSQRDIDFAHNYSVPRYNNFFVASHFYSK